MISVEEAALMLVKALHEAGIEYMLVGSFSSNYYGMPRSTHDADFVLHVEQQSIKSLKSHLPAELELESQQSFELVTGTKKHVVRVKGNGFLIELFHLSSDPHDQERFARRVRISLFGQQIYLASAEDVVITKLRWGRPKDHEDIQNVIAIQADRLDWQYITFWCQQHGTLADLEVIRQNVPEQ